MRSSDSRIRSLRRAYSTGDELAGVALAREMVRSGFDEWDVVPLLQDLGFDYMQVVDILEERDDGTEILLEEWRHPDHGVIYMPGLWEGNPKNPDVDLRELERRVAAGDREAVVPLVRALERSEQEVPLDLRALYFAQVHPHDDLVTYPNGRQRIVKNLGWLRRQLHRRGGSLTGRLGVLRFVVRTNVGEFPRECYLRVELTDFTDDPDAPPEYPGDYRYGYLHTHTYETMFASCVVLWDWLQTPLFENEVLDWDGHVGRIETRMHHSTYGHPAGSEGGPDAECYRCRRRYWSGDPLSHPERPMCPTCYLRTLEPEERRALEEMHLDDYVHNPDTLLSGPGAEGVRP